MQQRKKQQISLEHKNTVLQGALLGKYVIRKKLWLRQVKAAYLAQWGPFILSQLVHIVIEICISEKHLHCAQFIQEA